MSEFCTLGSAHVTSARLRWPQSGVPTADVDTEATEEFSGRSTLVLDGVSIPVHVVRGGKHAAQVKAFLAWGNGSMADNVPAKSYTDVTVRSLVTGISGAAVVGVTDTPTLARKLDKYTRLAGPKAVCLDALANALGAVWRVTDDGFLFFGEDAWTTYPIEHDLIANDVVRGCFRFGSDAVGIRPGFTYQNKKVQSVEIEFSPGQTSVYAYYGAGLTGTIEKAIKGLAPDVDPYGHYPCTVLSQSSDLKTVDVSTSHPKISGMTKVRFSVGLPGCKVKISRGAKVLVGFEGGDRQRPFVSFFSDADIAEITLKASSKVTIDAPVVDLAGGAGIPLARVGSVVSGTATVLGSPAPFVASISVGSDRVRG